MIAAVLLTALSQPSLEPVVRDGFGVPRISAHSLEQAYFFHGYATAQDRLWQMENSRRLARGQMAEAFGARMVNADTETLRTAYTEAELQAQIDAADPSTRKALEAYAQGVNFWMLEASLTDRLPSGYAQNELRPRPWTSTDSAAIAINLFQRFGRGGAGELRNLAAYAYLQNQPKVKGKELDVLDDFLWFNHPESTPTVPRRDDGRRPPGFAFPARAETERQLAAIPKPSLLELLPALRLLNREESEPIALAVGAVTKTGSYAMVVSPSRSASDRPLLLSAPQMGFSSPSIAHEAAIDAPGLSLRGMSVPGIPGILIGTTPQMAWGLTSGVADTDDIVALKIDGDRVIVNGQPTPIERVTFSLAIKGTDTRPVVQERTPFGPIILKSQGYAFVRRSSYWKKELRGLDAVQRLYRARSTREIDAALDVAPMSFNFFYATQDGRTGYVYAGDVPVRRAGVDPRFPVLEDTWAGILPKRDMPRVHNPKDGLILNWNNKPASWWPNGDTPVWGAINRVDLIHEALQKPKLTPEDLRLAAVAISRRWDTWAAFGPAISAAVERERERRYVQDPGAIGELARVLDGYRGDIVYDQPAAAAYDAVVKALREELFSETVGNFVTPEFFELAVQPSLMLRALEGKTKIDYRQGRSVEAIMDASLRRAADQLSRVRGPKADGWAFRGGVIRYGETVVPYSNRGTYIQIVELANPAQGATVLPPGVAESGPNATDQIPLAQAFGLKPMHPWPRPAPRVR